MASLPPCSRRLTALPAGSSTLRRSPPAAELAIWDRHPGRVRAGGLVVSDPRYASIESRRTAFGLPPDYLASLVVGNPPHPLFTDKEITRRESAAFELLLAQHQRHVAIDQSVLVKTRDARRVGVR